MALMPDGPSLGGFVCPATIPSAELWKMGQVRLLRGARPCFWAAASCIAFLPFLNLISALLLLQ